MKEIWKDIEGYEGLYQVSSEGRVRKIDGTILKATAKKNTYLKVSLVKDGKHRTFRIHRLVCIAFNGEPVGERIYVNHINGNKQDNSVYNLEWTTAKANANNPATRPNYFKRYHHPDEFQHRSEGQKRRFARERGLICYCT